jgi:hypothetical protein
LLRVSIAAVAEQAVRDTLADSGKTSNRPHHFFSYYQDERLDFYTFCNTGFFHHSA